MRDEINNALEGLRAGQRPANWYGKTRRQFWAWFHDMAVALEARAANDDELERIRDAVLDLRASADDAGYDGPDEVMDEVIERPAPLEQTRDQLDARIARLRERIPEVLAAAEKDQMDAFAGIADEILEDASDADREHAWSQIQCILREAGLIPGDEEPCDDGEAISRE